MKVLVTGATGFIGFHVINNLLKRKVEIIASSTSEKKAQTQSWFSDVSFVPHHLGKEENENLFEKFRRPDVVIHLAWQGLPNYKSLFHFEENLYQHYFFLKNLIANGATDITVTGTCFEYGMKSGCLTEGMDTDPTNPYGLAKDALRRFLQQLQQEHSFLIKWVRLFYMHGQGQNPKSLLAQLESALQRGDRSFNMSGGEQVRDFLPVEEVAENIVNIALQKETIGIINCCSGQPVTVKQLVQNYIQQSGKSIELNFGYYPYPDYEPMEFWGSNEKLRSIKKSNLN
jgi:nucleoside-diphosphate-sugar epimerase